MKIVAKKPDSNGFTICMKKAKIKSQIDLSGAIEFTHGF
jgi:hypothetical protein